MVASERNIKYIIDDGLLIKENEVIAGISAKKASTKIETVKKALFNNPEESKEIKKAFMKYKPESILILGTSDNMIEKIIENELIIVVLGQDNYNYKFYVDLFDVYFRRYPRYSSEYDSTHITIYKCHEHYPGRIEQLNQKAEKLATEYTKQKNQHGSWGENHFYEQYNHYFKFFRNQLLKSNDKLYADFISGTKYIQNKIIQI